MLSTRRASLGPQLRRKTFRATQSRGIAALTSSAPRLADLKSRCIYFEFSPRNKAKIL
jgi:hypothetical protein